MQASLSLEEMFPRWSSIKLEKTKNSTTFLIKINEMFLFWKVKKRLKVFSVLLWNLKSLKTNLYNTKVSTFSKEVEQIPDINYINEILTTV